jgi:hypothetical protein
MCINIFKKWKKQCVPHLIPPPKQFIIIHWWCTKLIPQDPILFTLPFSLQIRFSFWKWTFMLHLLSFEINPYIIHYESAQKRGLHNSHPQLRLKNSAIIAVSNALSLKSCTFFGATPQNPLWISLWNNQKLFSTVLVPGGVGCSGCRGVVS